MRAGIGDSGFGIRQGVQAPTFRFCKSRIPNPGSQQTNVWSSRQQGFSLLEVIAAIMLLAIAFTALMKVAGASINLSHNAAEHSHVAMLARSVLDSAFVGEPVTPGSRSGQFDRQYRWRLDVTPWNGAGNPAPEAPLHLYQLDLQVIWGAQAHPRSAHFRTLRLAGPASTGNPQAAR